MYLTKIWFLLVAAFATVALALALVMPRPAQRTALDVESARLERACTIANILLRDNARTRVQLAGEFARAAAPANEPTLRLDEILFAASKGELISAESNATGRKALAKLLDSFSGSKPDFVQLLDRRGRVVARWSQKGDGDEKYGQSLRGYYLIDDALAGYLRDDLWLLDGSLFRVAASPVVTRQLDWAGAVVVGHAVDKDFVDNLAGGLNVSMSFYANADAVASSDAVAIHKSVVKRIGDLDEVEPGADCREGKSFDVSAQGSTYTVLMSRLPGEAGELGAFYAVYSEKPEGLGFAGVVDNVRSDDLGFGNFPWILVGLVLVVMIGVGLFLMAYESDRPLKRLAEDAQLLSKGDTDKLREELHSGKYGSIARSLNVALDRLRREAKSAQKDLDELLGPAPSASIPLPASGPSPMAPAPPPPPPPPSEFKFSDSSRLARSQQPPHQAPAQPKPDLPIKPPPPAPIARQVPPRPVSLPGSPPVVSPLPDDEQMTMDYLPDEDDEEPQTVISQRSQKLAQLDAEQQHFRQIYEEFLATKRQCGEPADNLTFERFAAKLRKNRDVLISKHRCSSVRFQVYVKNGKAALKASPVR
jgi:hypothetical protein